MRLPITIPDGNGGVRMQTQFGVYANLVRIGIGPTTPFQNFDHQTQYIWPQPGTPLTGTLTSCPINPGAYGQGYIPDFDSPPGANTGKGVQFFQWPGGVPGVGAVVPPTSTSLQPDDTIHGSMDNTLVAQVVNTDPSINAPNVTADFHFANWGLGPAQFPLWTEAQGANPMPTAPTTIPAGGALKPLTSDWASANIPSALKGTHQCVWVVLNSNQEVQFIQDSVRRNMNIATLSEHRATAEVSGKGYPPPPSGSNHRFVLVVSAFAEPIIPQIVIESQGPHLAELFDAAAPPVVVWHWFTFGFVRHPDEVLVINKRKYEAWLPAPGGFGILAGHDNAEHPFNSDLLGPGMKRLARGVYELPVPHNGSVKIQTVLTAAPASDLPPTIEQGSTGPVVRQCQFLLSVEGYGIGPVQINGKFDATMKAVVQRFQHANGLTADGVVGPKSWTELIADAPVQTEIFVPPFDHSDTVFVTRLQQTLNGARKWFAAGAAPLAEDGNFGPATQALVKAVQTWGAIQSTGTPNDQTWAISAGPTIWDVAGPGTAGTKPHQEPTVRMGSKGEAVQIAQFLLSAQGFGLAPHQVDGNFGQATHDAVVRFQRAHKLTADGVVGPGTWKQLFAHPPVAETPPTLHQGASGPVVSGAPDGAQPGRRAVRGRAATARGGRSLRADHGGAGQGVPSLGRGDRRRDHGLPDLVGVRRPEPLDPIASTPSRRGGHDSRRRDRRRARQSRRRPRRARTRHRAPAPGEPPLRQRSATSGAAARRDVVRAARGRPEAPNADARAGRVRPPPEWERAFVSALEELMRRAARPAREAVPANADAVLFADPAEMLACLARDRTRGETWARWWWRSLVPSLGAHPDAEVAMWLERPEHAPAALEILTARGDAVSFAATIAPAAATELAARVAGAFAAPALRVAITEPVERRAADRMPARSETLDPPWSAVAAPSGAASLQPEQQLMLGTLLMLRHAAGVARTRAFAARVRQWRVAVAPPRSPSRPPRPAVPTQHPAPEPAPSAHARPVSTVTSAHEPDATARPRPGPSVPQPGVDATPPDRNGTAAGRASVQRAGVGCVWGPRDTRPSQDHRLRSCPGWSRFHVRSIGRRQRPARPNRHDRPRRCRRRRRTRASRPPTRPRHRPSRDRSSRATRRRGAVPQPTPRHAEREPERGQPTEALAAATVTRLGGLFYLVNLALYLDLYSDFTRPLEPGLALNPWELVELLGEWLLAGRPQDPVWDLLAELAGRGRGEPPGRGFTPPRRWRVPPAWLEPFATGRALAVVGRRRNAADRPSRGLHRRRRTA